ncbi:hypothetical protein GALMADRAFT_246301 [Galerina marginata CBS 339.88]|uniref:Uncharacterized protein n=1 Tax=Galerina marginata (strain CBS 339.88) TaxID=685588 RepID=A0A067TDP4_GALM3|nr:hypothetical protein GALMADRAFT_246301 [Galerina marginata CBS 339.88]
MSTHTDPQAGQADILKTYASYPFDSDETYQQGLASILGGTAFDINSPLEVQEETKRRTRVFYFNKITGNSITAEEARDYELSLQNTPQEPSNAGDEARVLTFSELKELIETGNVDKIPNNKIIPEGLNVAPPSESTAAARKKPWEIATDS